MAEFYADDKARENRLAAIRAKRGTAERDEHISQIAAQKEAEKAAKAKRKSTSSSARKTRENSTEYHGHSWDEWDQMRDAGLALIAERARERKFVSSTELWTHLTTVLGKELGNSHFQLPALSEHIAAKDFDESKPLVTALVTYDEAGSLPSAGFFRLAAEKGLIPQAEAPDTKTPFTAMTEAQRAFWQSQVDALFERYAAAV